MFRQIRWRIAIPFILLISLILIGLGIYLVNSIRQTKLQDFEDQLTIEGYLLADVIQSLSINNDLPSSDLDNLAKHWATLLEARVTIIAPNGEVIGESAGKHAECAV